MDQLQWLLFLLAWTVSYFAHAMSSVLSESNGVESVVHWLRLNYHSVLYNLVATIAIALMWKEAPSAITGILNVPITNGTSMGAGLVIQNLLDRGLFLFGVRVEMPKLVPPSQ